MPRHKELFPNTFIFYYAQEVFDNEHLLCAGERKVICDVEISDFEIYSVRNDLTGLATAALID